MIFFRVGIEKVITLPPPKVLDIDRRGQKNSERKKWKGCWVHNESWSRAILCYSKSLWSK